MSSYPGSKQAYFRQIVNQITPHDVFVAPFAGGGGVLLNKRPAKLNVGVDLDGGAISRLGSARPGALVLRGDDAVKMGLGAVAVGGPAGNWAGWVLVQGDGISFIQGLSGCTGRVYVYADPPYLLDARRSGRRLYRYEMDAAAHERFLGAVVGLDCHVGVSGYWSELYGDMLSGWRLVEFGAMTRGGPAVECLWFNYPAPKRLHDYSWLGDTFRERERIKRQQSRWLGRLRRLPELERAAMLAEIWREFG